MISKCAMPSSGLKCKLTQNTTWFWIKKLRKITISIIVGGNIWPVKYLSLCLFCERWLLQRKQFGWRLVLLWQIKQSSFGVQRLLGHVHYTSCCLTFISSMCGKIKILYQWGEFEKMYSVNEKDSAQFLSCTRVRYEIIYIWEKTVHIIV